MKAAIDAARVAVPHLSAADALKLARSLITASSVEVDVKLDDYIRQGEAMENETDVLRQKDNIHPAIQALWGVYVSNEFNAFNTMMKINMLLASQRMAQTIYDHGKANGYIFDSGDVYIDGQRVVPLGGTGTQANRNKHGTLAGAYGPAHLAAGLKELHGNTAFTNSLWNGLRALTGYAMATKTKYSITGTWRNFLGNTVFPIINLNIFKVLDKKALAVVGRQLNLRSKDKTAYDAYIRRLIELRVVSESAYEFRDLCKEFSQTVTSRIRKAPAKLKKLANMVSMVDDYAGRAHQSADDFWKVLSFEAELAKIKRWEPGLSDKEAEEKAAWKIRHTMPTYTEAFYFIKKLRQQIFIAPFITFTAEMWRVAYGTIRVGFHEMSEGRRLGKWTMWTHGLARALLSLSATLALGPAMAMIAKAVFGAGDDDKKDEVSDPGFGETALARFVPDYMKNNVLLRFGSSDEGNRQVYMDASYMVPHDVIARCFRGVVQEAMKPENETAVDKTLEGAIRFLGEFSKPVTNEQLFFGSIWSAWHNYNTAYDRPIFDKMDTRKNKITAALDYIYTSAFEPGTFRTGRLLKEAADGVVRDGMKMEIPNEIFGVFGIKKRTILIDERLARNCDSNKMDLNKAAQYITKPLRSRSTIQDEDITEGYENANRVRMNILREVRRDYLAALELGVPKAKAKARLSASSLSDDDVRQVIGNIYIPFTVDEQVFTDAVARSKEMGHDRVRLYLDAVKTYPKRQPLIPE